MRGFQRLGYDTWFVEQIDRSACADSAGGPAAFEDSINLAYFRQVVEQFGLSDRAALIFTPGGEVFGPDLQSLVAAARSAELLFNISGHLTLPAIMEDPRVRVYYDDDPGFTQFWHAAGSGASRLDGHDAYYTIGQNIGAADCPIPTGGIAWRHTRPPVVLDDWPAVAPHGPSASSAPRALRFTTVASWRGPYGPVLSNGKTYGPKAHQFRRFLSLPRLTGQRFEIALDIHPNDGRDLAALRENDWTLADPSIVAAAPEDFRHYVQESDAEFSVAQGMYVDTRSGWFSDRTTRYLASGRPALVQDTGFADHLPVGEGLLTFNTLEEAAAGADEIRRDYAAHSRAARNVAETYFDSDKVIARLLEEIDLPQASPVVERQSR